MNKTGKHIAFLLFGLITSAAFLSGCTDGNPPSDFNTPSDKHTLSISLLPQTKSGDGLRANYEIEDEVVARESKIYSLAVFVFKNGSDELDGKKIIKRSYEGAVLKELSEIKDIELTAGMRDVYIIANAPDNHFDSNVSDRNEFKAKLEDLANQGMFGTGGSGSTEIPIGAEDPDDRCTNLVMTQSFLNLPLNSGAEKHYLGYPGTGLPSGATGTPLLDGTNPFKVELVRLVARVAIQKIKFQLPAQLTFGSYTTNNYNCYVDTVFLVNAKAQSSYFPEEAGFVNPSTYEQGNTTGYEFLEGETLSFGISSGSTYADYLFKPISNVKEYDIEGNHAPLWFYAFENKDSDAYPTSLVIGVVFQYRDALNAFKDLKVYYPVVINGNGGGTPGKFHTHIKRNFQYGINVTITGLGSLSIDYPGVRSALTSMDTSGVMEIEETVGTNLFPWTGNVYK